MRQTLAVLLGLVSAAHADMRVSLREPPELTLGTPTGAARIESARITTKAGRTRLTLVVASDASVEQEIWVPIFTRAHAVGLAITIDGSRLEASTVPARAGREAFGTNITWKLDPALLEQNGAGSLRLGVFPVSAGRPATVEITFGTGASVDGATSLYAGWASSMPTLKPNG